MGVCLLLRYFWGLSRALIKYSGTLRSFCGGSVLPELALYPFVPTYVNMGSDCLPAVEGRG